jgi:hypothetical protein
MKNKLYYYGLLLIATSIVLGRFVQNTDFFQGFCLSLGITLIIGTMLKLKIPKLKAVKKRLTINH